MRQIYNILFTIFFWLSAPYYFWKMWRRGDWREGFEQRFGQFSAKTKQSLTNRHILWIHAVSVGEVNVCTQLIRALEPRLPNVKIVVSTTTSTGMAELKKKLPSHIEKIYYPIDRKRFVSRSINVIHPEAVILVEAEIWPNFLWRLREKSVPTFLVNARLSPRSFRGYRRYGFLFRNLFSSFTGVGAQNDEDAGRLLELGCRKETIRVVGSLKFDAAPLDERRLLNVPALLRQLGVPEDAQILLGGSTHAGEEEVLASIYLKLKQTHPKLFLIVVPRHFERSKQVAQELDKLGIQYVYRSNITNATRHDEGSIQCLVVNTTGELRHFYAEATVIFVGKSLKATGGQNPIEPGALGKPIIFGPHMENFESIASAFVSNKAAIQVRGEPELQSAIDKLLSDPARCTELGEKAKRVVRENQGAIDRTVEMILHGLKDSELAGMIKSGDRNDSGLLS